MRITVVGLGYVGLANAILFAQKNTVVGLDTLPEKVAMINRHESPLKDKEIIDYLTHHALDLTATTDKAVAYADDPDYVVIATPTDYDDVTNHFDTRSVEAVITDARELAPNATIIIKSTIPVGFTKEMRARFDSDQLVFSPEFLREGHALYDNLHPSRIIVGGQSKEAAQFADLLRAGSLDSDTPVLLTDSTEAEAVKLFSNTYLAMRVAYFNELDTYARMKGLNAKQIIDGVGLDPRIGTHYNNPSFGYGGYCLPKDSKQLMANYQGVPNDIITAVVAANQTRKAFIANDIIHQHPKHVGIYRLTMKAGSDNFRKAAILDVMDALKQAGIAVSIYEPSWQADAYQDVAVEHDFDTFIKTVDLIVANRVTPELEPVMDKVYTRDLYQNN